MDVDNSLETLNDVDIVVVEFDEEKEKLTIENPENDWSGKSTDLVGGDSL